MQKIYKEDQAKIEANRATAPEREAHNERVQEAKDRKAAANRAIFVPRKASHKQA